MAEHNRTEIPRSPDAPYAFEGEPADGFEAGILGGIAYGFCAGECPARQKVEKKGLACPFLITQLSQSGNTTDWDSSDPALSMLEQVAENTWMHCVDDVRGGGEPVILLDLKTP